MADMPLKMEDAEARQVPSTSVDEVPINASGHSEQLERNYGLLSMTGLAICSGNTWITLGGAITVAIYNGGPAGVLYEFIAVSVCYWFVAASIAELASAMPSAGGVYHWASITAGQYGRANGFFAGWLNFLAWIFGLASVLQIMSAQVVSMYAVYHPAYVTERWHVFIVYIIFTWLTCAVVLFANKALPICEHIGGASVVVCVFITIVICATMPQSTGDGYASSHAVWEAWDNETGYSSDGLAFCLGMLNGAYCVGTPDLTSHMAEEIPNPSRNIPRAMFMQYVVGFLTGLLYGIALFYSVTDLDSVLESSYLFPLTAIYYQTTGTAGGTLGLLFLAFVPLVFAVFGCYLTASRVLWTLARDGAAPFSGRFAQVSPRFKNPFNAILACGVTCTVLGCIYVGSFTAFNAFVGSFAILASLSYFLAIFPHLVSGRKRIRPGHFWMSGGVGYFVNAVSCVYTLAFAILFCFPFSLPVDAATMNYASLMTGGLTLFVAAFWFWCQRDYKGPRYVPPGSDAVAKEAM